MKLAKVRFDSDDACGRALKGLATRMKITVLADESFIVPESGIEWLRAQGLPFKSWNGSTRIMSFRRYEITLPTRYNDGIPSSRRSYPLRNSDRLTLPLDLGIWDFSGI